MLGVVAVVAMIADLVLIAYLLGAEAACTILV
jgi:hypothetical protein